MPPLGRPAIGGAHEHPVSAGALQEGSRGYDDGLGVSSELQTALSGRALDERGWTSRIEIKLYPELAVADLRKDPPYSEACRLSLKADGRHLPDPNARQVKLIDICNQLHPGLRSHLREALTGSSSLTHLEIDSCDFASHRRAHDETV